MTGNQIKKILNTFGIPTTNNVIEGIKIPEITKILLSQNFYVVPERDIFTFDFNNELIKIKQMNGEKPWSNHKYDIYFDMNNIIGIEMLSVRSRY